VVCTAENRFRSHIVAALERYQRRNIEPSQFEKNSLFLAEQFAGVVPKDNKLPASSVDPEKYDVVFWFVNEKHVTWLTNVKERTCHLVVLISLMSPCTRHRHLYCNWADLEHEIRA
jgi:hypothetical protein